MVVWRIRGFAAVPVSRLRRQLDGGAEPAGEDQFLRPFASTRVFDHSLDLPERGRRHALVTVGKENSPSIDLYYEDHGSGQPGC